MLEDKEWTPMVESCDAPDWLDWTEEFEEMIVEEYCPNCEWEPDSEDNIISYGPLRYDSWGSRESSFPQYICAMIMSCPKCSTKFKFEWD